MLNQLALITLIIIKVHIHSAQGGRIRISVPRTRIIPVVLPNYAGIRGTGNSQNDYVNDENSANSSVSGSVWLWVFFPIGLVIGVPLLCCIGIKIFRFCCNKKTSESTEESNGIPELTQVVSSDGNLIGFTGRTETGEEYFLRAVYQAETGTVLAIPVTETDDLTPATSIATRPRSEFDPPSYNEICRFNSL